MYTEKYAATAPPTAAGGASLGVVGGRIDFWDNGYQQAISQPYTVAPGETLQTHCWFSTTPMASQIEFGTPTSSEMCQDFIFYYPAQYRGVDTGGSPERFAMCGISGPVAGAAITLCGSLAQSGGTTPYIVGDQVDKGDGAKADPLNFGTANRGANASVPGSICAYVSTPSLPPSLSPSPSPAPSPPSPFSPGSELVTVYRVKVELIAEGSVSDITTEKKAAIQRAFATAAGVPESRVAVTVQAASVLISVIITSMTQSSASAVQATLAARLVDSAAATEFLEEAAIVVTSTPVLTSYSETVAQDPLDTVREARDRRHGMHVAHGLLMTLAFGFFMPAGTAFPLFLRSLLPHGRWLRWHNGFQLVGLALCTAGFGVGIAMSTRHFRSLHTILGLVVVILSYLQGGLAVVRPKTPSAKGTEIGEEPYDDVAQGLGNPPQACRRRGDPWSLPCPTRDRGATPGRRDQAAAAATLWALRSDALAGGCIPRRSLCRQAQGICGYRGRNGVVGVQHLRHGCKSFRRGPQYSAISRRSRVGCTSSG